MWDLIVSVPDHCLSFYFENNVGRKDLFDQFRKIIIRHKRIRYNMCVMRHTACLMVMVNNFAALFNCMPVGRASDLMMAPA